MKVETLLTTSLTIAQASKLFGITKDKLNGTITNDKFCLSRWDEMQLSWWRRPLRLRS
jgi:hypothetical protein